MNKVDNFIGETFKTPRGGVLTVLGHNGLKSSKKKYRLVCSLCSQDSELFPRQFESEKGSLKKGKVPCGCATTPHWSREQYEIRINRECEKRGFLFHGFLGKGRIGIDTNLKLECLRDGTLWKSTKVSSFFQGSRCPECAKVASKLLRTKPDEYHINLFMGTGAFVEGTTFKRNKVRTGSQGRYNYWDVTCPSCSNDMFVQAGVCSGIFTSQAGSLKAGSLACRCAPNYTRTKDQREWEVRRLLEKEGGVWRGWIGKDNRAKFLWDCKEGHTCENSTVRDFLSKGSRCATCSGFGYNPMRKGESDYLYLLQFKSEEESFIKIGRSFNVERRMKELSRASKCEVQLLGVYESTHESVCNLEKSLHFEHRGLKYSPRVSFGGQTECFTLKVLSRFCVVGGVFEIKGEQTVDR